jgi:hypothetical protein
VTIDVAAVADIAADTTSTVEDTAVTINVLANDDFENASRTITAVDGIAITAGGPAVTLLNGTGTVALNASGQLIFTPTPDFSNASATTFSYTVTSGGATETANVTVSPITAVNDAPVLAAGSTHVYGDAAAASTPRSRWSRDNNTLSTGTVAITTNFQTGQDILSFTNVPATMGNIAGVYNALTGVMSLSSAGNTATLAHWQAALRAVTYSNSSENPSGLERTVSYTVNDAAANSNTVTSMINVTPVNDAPTLAATTVNVTRTETATAGDTAPVATLFSGAAISTIEAGQTIKGLSFTVTGLQDGASEKIVIDGTTIFLGANISGWTATNGLVYTSVGSGGTATVTLSGGNLSAAQAQTLVNGITYQDTRVDNPTAGARTFTLSQVQDSGGTANGGVDTSTGSIVSTVTVAVTNDLPVLDLDASAAGTAFVFIRISGRKPRRTCQDCRFRCVDYRC